MASLDAMPPEIQLNISRRLVPEDPNNVERHDLASLRLTCKGVRAAATEIYFRDLFLLIRKEGDVYVEPRSWKLLAKKPHLAQLVQHVWIALAAAEPDWLRKQSSFNRISILDEEAAITSAYKATKMYKLGHCDDSESSDEDMDESGTEDAFTSKQCDAIREYYRQFINPPAWENEYKLPVTSNTLEVLLTRRLQCLPNLRQVRAVRPSIQHTQFFKKRLSYCMEEGLEKWAFALTNPKYGDYPSSHCFPYQPIMTMLGLKLLPPNCSALELDILLYDWPFSQGGTKIALSQDASACWSQVTRLDLRIEPCGVYYTEGLRASPGLWAQLWTKFENVTSLSLLGRSKSMTLDSMRKNQGHSISEHFLPALSMVGVRSLSLQGWVLRRSSFVRFQSHFPRLHTIHLENISIETTADDRKKKRFSLWLSIARRIKKDFGSSCSLLFGKGPFMEAQGSLRGELGNYSDEDDPAITRILKEPTLMVLSEISRNVESDTDLIERYTELVEHWKPDCYADAWDLSMREYECDLRPHTSVVETQGITAVYYEVLRSGSEEM